MKYSEYYWNMKYFKTQDEAEKFMSKNSLRYQLELIFVEDGFAVQYRKLKIMIIN